MGVRCCNVKTWRQICEDCIFIYCDFVDSREYRTLFHVSPRHFAASSRATIDGQEVDS